MNRDERRAVIREAHVCQLFHDESKRLTCQAIRLDWCSVVGYA
ncbi:hypothetical protein SynA1544_02711 [Synechococcus sp. A15-44]|nr:hypothetical protein SynA1544_02711 [Synechococcus sp. A15-44]